ncbi:AMP-binding protein [Paraburkholderia acidipaludis]|uniref:AMP-binding protein n=1 Tax=Paraburkholderia acidipaludis TaxID=660537 RepID=UPI0004813CAB|nr:AMP-binding protein [Paraburkholderia acidipaludis]
MVPAIWFGGRNYSPAWMQAEIQRILAGLHGLQCKEGDTVAAMLRNSPEYVALVLACRQAGLYLASINWHFKALEAGHILTDSAARTLFVDADLLAQIREGIPEGVHIVAVAPADTAATDREVHRWTDFGSGLPPMPPRTGLLHGAITYTSGTTGKPKGVRRIPWSPDEQAQMQPRLQRVVDIVYGTGTGVTAYFSAPIYHSAVMNYLLHFSQLGATLVMEPRFDADRALDLLAQHRVTHAYLVPTMYQRLLAVDPAARARRDLSALRHVASTGSPCAAPLKQAMIEWLGPVITEAYGSSEAGYTTFIDSADWLTHAGSAGRPLPDAEVRILDENGNPLPMREIGLIYVRQRAVPDFTYINRPDARAAAERDGLVTLGDMGYLDEDGFLYICDRKADMVISGGVNIYPAEIESVLLTMPGVEDCAVFGIPDSEFGEALAAAVQPRAGSHIEAHAVQHFLRERIANYKVPRVVEIHAALPREDSGKIFKRRLREPYWQGQTRAI